MALSKTNIVDFAQVIANAQGSTVTMNIAYDEVMQNLAQRPDPPLLESTAFTISSGTASYTFPSAAIKIVGLFNESRQLRFTNRVELESYNREWRASSDDTPLAFFTEEDTLRSMRLFPSPSTGSTGTWLMSVVPTAVPEYMALYIAFMILEKEFAYLSDHQDKEFSTVCGQIAVGFGKLIGF